MARTRASAATALLAAATTTVLLLLLLPAPTHGAGDADWRTRTIYQVLTDRFSTNSAQGDAQACSDLSTWCGGVFAGVTANLDYIAGMGFDAVWISPIPLQIDGGYHGYWFKDLYAIDPHFGSEQELRALADALHARGMYLMLDVVANHAGCAQCFMGAQCYGNCDYAQISPFDTADSYHDVCQINDWNDQSEVEYCRLSNLPDLDQDDAATRAALLDWVAQTVAKYDIDGLRIDTVPEVGMDFWADFVTAAGVYSVGEVFSSDMAYVASYQSVVPGVLSYPLYDALLDVFAYGSGDLYELADTWDDMLAAFDDVTLLGSFIDNHDNERFLYRQQDYMLYRSALLVVLGFEGIPIVYYGTEQGYAGGDDPACRESLWPNLGNTDAELYVWLAAVNAVRAATQYAAQPQVERYVDDQFYAWSRGDALFAVCNAGGGGGEVYRQVTYTPYLPNTLLCNALAAYDCTVTGASGEVDVYLDAGEPKLFYPAAQLAGDVDGCVCTDTQYDEAAAVGEGSA